MPALLASLLIVAAFAGAVYYFAPKSGERWGVMLERYRPHAPMSDWSVGEFESSRQHADLAALAARQPDPNPTAWPRRLRRAAPAVARLSEIPCRGETVQF